MRCFFSVEEGRRRSRLGVARVPACPHSGKIDRLVALYTTVDENEFS